MFSEHIFCDALRDAYGKSEENDKKCLDDESHMIIVTFVQIFFLIFIQKLTSACIVFV